MIMEPNDEEAVLILNVSQDGKKTYTLQSDPTKRYTVNENGELVELNEECREIKLELADDKSPNSPDTLFTQLEDRNLNLIDVSLGEEMADFDMESEAIDANRTNKRCYQDDDMDLEEEDDILIMHMDIRDPLSTLRCNLEQRLGVNLHDYSFWLQDSSQLESHKNLVDQCVSGEGLVQVNVQIRAEYKVINIVDVLKPADEYTDLNDDNEDTNDLQEHLYEYSRETERDQDESNNASTGSQEVCKNQMIKRWTIDNQFKRDQQRLQIPTNPYEWSEIHVRHWLQWAVRQFSLTRIKLSDWVMTGEQLCNLTLAEFQEKVPEDPNDIFWTHLELLKKCKLVAVLQQSSSKDDDYAGTFKTKLNRSPSKLYNNVSLSMVEATSGYNCGNRTGNNGQIQLWQFLLELLTDKTRRQVIQWVGNDGEFKLISPELVAQLWGERKNKPTMNYEKLSRALRYYYDGDMISKVPGKRFVYKFVCDLKQLIGYDAAQLAMLVESCDKAWRRE